MQFDETELDDLRWALHTSLDRLKRIISAVYDERGLMPTVELIDKVARLEALCERFGPPSNNYRPQP